MCGIGDWFFCYVRFVLFLRWGVVFILIFLMILCVNVICFVLVGWDIFRWSCDVCVFNVVSDLYFLEWYNIGYVMK